MKRSFLVLILLIFAGPTYADYRTDKPERCPCFQSLQVAGICSGAELTSTSGITQSGGTVACTEDVSDQVTREWTFRTRVFVSRGFCRVVKRQTVVSGQLPEEVSVIPLSSITVDEATVCLDELSVAYDLLHSP
jgi:hypothetical protein